MIRLYYYAFGQYWYSHSVSAYHSRTETMYFGSVNEMSEWLYQNGYYGIR